MQKFNSADGGDGNSEGLCACETVTDLMNNTVMDAMNDDDEIVIIAGHEICKIYDGVRIEPVLEIARFTVAQFNSNFEQIAEQYEIW